MSFIFASSLYRTEGEMIDAIVWAYLSADGMNSADEIRETLIDCEFSDLAVDVLECWNDYQNDGGSVETLCGLSAAELEPGFDRLWERIQIADEVAHALGKLDGVSVRILDNFTVAAESGDLMADLPLWDTTSVEDGLSRMIAGLDCDISRG
jgi:hypothetical protein